MLLWGKEPGKARATSAGQATCHPPPPHPTPSPDGRRELWASVKGPRTPDFHAHPRWAVSHRWDPRQYRGLQGSQIQVWQHQAPTSQTHTKLWDSLLLLEGQGERFCHWVSPEDGGGSPGPSRVAGCLIQGVLLRQAPGLPDLALAPR